MGQAETRAAMVAAIVGGLLVFGVVIVTAAAHAPTAQHTAGGTIIAVLAGMVAIAATMPAEL